MLLSPVRGSPGGTSGKEPTCQCRRLKRHSSIPGLGKSPGEGNGNPFQYSCLGNPMDRRPWWAAVYRVSKTQTQFSSVQSLSHVQLFVTPWTAAHQALLSITNSQSVLKLMSIELVMPSNHLMLCRPLLLLPSIFPSIRVFKNVSSSHQVAKVLEFQLQHQSFQ